MVVDHNILELFVRQELFELGYEAHDLRDVEGPEVGKERVILQIFVDAKIERVFNSLRRIRI